LLLQGTASFCRRTAKLFLERDMGEPSLAERRYIIVITANGTLGEPRHSFTRTLDEGTRGVELLSVKSLSLPAFQ
jgi:hypothetical protein